MVSSRSKVAKAFIAAMVVVRASGAEVCKRWRLQVQLLMRSALSESEILNMKRVDENA